MEPTSTYRTEIDGLRAAAVIAVVLFHYHVWPFTGGFVGVDVFFVISGYLITRILRAEMIAGQFSVLHFYDRRVRRILPALLVVIAVTLVVGWFVMLPGDYDAFGKQAFYAAFGLSNFYFRDNTGYFDQTADLLPLLHTWSLAVEEQFYVVWPIILAIALKLASGRENVVRGLLAVIIVCGFVASLVAVHEAPDNAFYMTWFRAWELAVGAYLAFVPAIRRPLIGATAPAVGLVLILSSVLMLDAEVLFPGANALAPVMGAALIVWPNDHLGLVKRLLSLRPARYLGGISYSLYLWHWPVLVLFRHYANTEYPTPVEAVLLLVVSYCLSVTSYHLVEQPIRRFKPARQWKAPAIGAISALVLAVPAFAIARLDGVPERLAPYAYELRSLSAMWEWDCERIEFQFIGRRCVFGAPWEQSEHRIFLWGDSHAEHLAPLLETAIEPETTSVVLFNACPAILGGTVHLYRPDRPSYHDLCVDTRERAIEFLERTEGVDLVILAASWTGRIPLLYREGSVEERSFDIGEGLMAEALAETVEATSRDGRSFLFVAQFPGWGETNPVQCLLSRALPLRKACSTDALPVKRFWETAASTHIALERAAAQLPQVKAILYPGAQLCGDEPNCTVYINDQFIYRDTSHIRRNLSQETLSQLASLIGLTDVIKRSTAVTETTAAWQAPE